MTVNSIPLFKNDTCPKQKLLTLGISTPKQTWMCDLSRQTSSFLPTSCWEYHIICAFSKPKTSPLHELPQDGSRQGSFVSLQKIAQNHPVEISNWKNLYPRLYPCLKFICFQWCQVEFHLEIHPIGYTSTDRKIASNDPKSEDCLFRRDESYHRPNGILTCTCSPTHLLNNLVVFPHGRFQFRLEFFKQTHRLDWNT